MSTTVAEKIGHLEQGIADLRLALERFPDARMDGGRVVSQGVTLENADVIRPETEKGFGDSVLVTLRLGVRITRDLVVWDDERFSRRYAHTVLDRLMSNPETRAVLLAAMKVTL